MAKIHESQDKKYNSINIRFESFIQNEKSKEIPFSIWLDARIKEWSVDSGREVEFNKEREQGWQFPRLVSLEQQREFNDWLLIKYPIKLKE